MIVGVAHIEIVIGVYSHTFWTTKQGGTGVTGTTIPFWIERAAVCGIAKNEIGRRRRIRRALRVGPTVDAVFAPSRDIEPPIRGNRHARKGARKIERSIYRLIGKGYCTGIMTNEGNIVQKVSCLRAACCILSDESADGGRAIEACQWHIDLLPYVWRGGNCIAVSCILIGAQADPLTTQHATVNEEAQMGVSRGAQCRCDMEIEATPRCTVGNGVGMRATVNWRGIIASRGGIPRPIFPTAGKGICKNAPVCGRRGKCRL